MAALAGSNPSKTVYLPISDKQYQAGKFVDPWGTPYRIDTSNPDFPWMYSFGKNKIDEGGAPASDDVASWQ
jgi:hypothetical protein